MIKYSIRGENIEVTEALRDYVESKLSKVEKYFHEDQELHARVNLKVYREKTAKVEVTIPTGSVTLRAEDVSLDMYGSIDLVVDKIARQIRKNKTKIARKYREKVPTGEMFSTEFNKEEVEEAPAVEVVRIKNIELNQWMLKKQFFKWSCWDTISLFILIAKIIQLTYYISVKMVTMA